MGNRITTREGFVSDNLVNLGKRLQINHDLKNAPETDDAGGAPQPPPAPEKLAVRRAAVERSEAERMHRELRDRIGHDAAAAESELAQLTAAQEELARFREFLTAAAAELDAIDPADDTAIRRIEEIRYRCFTASGRAQTFFNAPAGRTASGPGAVPERRSFGAAARESLPLALAIIAGALIVGAAILLALS